MGKSRRKAEHEREGKRRAKRQVYLICALLVLITVVVFWRATGFGFATLDDGLYVTNNPYIADGLTLDGVQWSLTTNYQKIWMPLLWISYMVDHDISSLVQGSPFVGGADPRVCHVHNILLHIANVLLLLLALRWMTGRSWLSAFIAALFAVHPLRVESVAWIAERKDVLSTLFWMLTMLAYLRYLRKPGFWRYAGVLLAFALGLMSKGTVVTLPVALLILDYWPLNRVGTGDGQISLMRALREKIPMLVLAIPCVILTMTSHGPAATGEAGYQGIAYPLGERAATAFVSYIQYILMMFWPLNLGVLYPFAGNTMPVWHVVASSICFAGLSVFALWAARTRPYITAGWLWYVVTLLPVIGFVQVGPVGLADRFTYVPMIGLFIAVAWGASELLNRLGGFMSERPFRAGLAVGLTVALMACSHIQVGYWRDSCTILRHTICVTGPNVLAHHALGLALAAMKKPNAAIDQYHLAMRIDAHNPDLLFRLGCLLTERGSPADLDEAIRLFQATTRLAPKGDLTRNWLGIALARRGRLDEAIFQFRESIRLNPGRTEAQANLDRALALKRQKN